eukprot:6671926-Pyramimonas_sp.AAC.2
MSSSLKLERTAIAVAHGGQGLLLQGVDADLFPTASLGEKSVPAGKGAGRGETSRPPPPAAPAGAQGGA